MKGTVVATAVLLLAGPLAAPAKQVVEIRVRGHFFAAPATIPLTIAVEPGASNRALVVEADSDDYYRSSTIELDGENEKRLHSLELRNLPAGAYVLRAQVRSKSEILGTAVNELVVTGMTPAP
jgi:hypothetical protein